jgi:hypothetical protein
MRSFRDWPTQVIEMPCGDFVVCLIYQTGQEPRFSVREENHNLFRLDKDSNMIWQVTRDEGERVQWALMREKAEAENTNDVSTNSPFMTLIQRFSDGTTNRDPLTGAGPTTSKWIEGATVICRTLDPMVYELNIETGVALNKTPFGSRRW